VGKDAAAPYRGGRSRSWIKVRTERVEDFVVVGWTDPDGSREGFGALHLARWAGADLRYEGSVGSGFSAAQLKELHAMLQQAETQTCPCSEGAAPTGRGHHWVRPELVVEVRFKERTDQGLLRQPVFLRVRDDKTPEECGDSVELPMPTDATENAEGASPGGPGDAGTPPSPTQSRDARPARPEPAFTNTDKVFWPEEGYTKGDLLEYHRRIAPWMLPYLRDRPLVMTRYPDGIRGKSFFQKDAPPHAPDWIRTVTVWSEGSERELSYFVADDVESLLYIVNLGTIPIHVWGSRTSDLTKADWCVLDLDPKEAPFGDVVKVALVIKEICDEIGLPSFPKTSGSSGIHLLVPLAGMLDHEQARTLGELLGRVAVTRRPDVATLTRSPGKREGKVYVDFVQNGQGRLIAAPFTVRPLPGAPVSAPLDWDEVGPDLSIRAHTMKTVPDRMERLGHDPLRAVLEAEPDFFGALARLGERLG